MNEQYFFGAELAKARKMPSMI